MAAFTADSINILNGQDVAEITSAEPINTIRKGDFLFLGGFKPVEILQAYKNGQGERFIELLKPWPHTSQTNQSAIVIPTNLDFRAAVEALQAANTLVSDNKKAMGDWQTNMGNVTFKDKDGNDVVVKTLRQIEADNQAQMNAYHPYPWAMRKVEFEAMRAANNDKFAASGFVHFGNHRQVPPNYNSIDNGLFTELTAPNILNLGSGSGNTAVSGTSKTDLPVLNIAGVLTELVALSVVGTGYQANRIKLPPAEDGTRTYDSATGVSVTHATSALAFAAETATNKVVTDRVDMWGFEAFLREINDSDPFVYKNGLIQSLASDINGVATVNDNVRPVTYFAWYEGDTTSRGKGVNWQTATEAQRIAIATDLKNNILFDDATGKFYQWCIRGRSFAGAGNGDWNSIKSNGLEALAFKQTHTRVKAQGNRNLVPAFGSGAPDDFVNASHAASISIDKALFNDRSSETSDAGAGCYFLVCGTVNRLNQGAYHPSYNPSGTSTVVNAAGTGSHHWYNSDNKPISTLECFTKRRVGTGNVGSVSGRPDGRYYDAIYSSGQGGVCRDMRYSAWGLKAEDFAEADLKIKSGEYRGTERLNLTKIYDFGVVEATDTSGSYPHLNYAINVLYDNIKELVSGEHYQVYNIATGDLFDSRSVDLSPTTQTRRNLYYPASWGINVDVLVIYEMVTDTSVSSIFMHTEVIGDPAKILLCEDLKNGWVGSWNPTIPDGQVDLFRLSKPYSGSGSDIKRIYTGDNGVSWTSGTINLSDPVVNGTQFTNMSVNQVTIYQYKVKAKMTTDVVNSEVYGNTHGLGTVFAGCYFGTGFGRELQFSLTGKIPTSNYSNQYETLTLDRIAYAIKDNKLNANNSYTTSHTLLEIRSPNNDSPAFKALNCNAVENQQAFINYAYTELHYDETAGDWGDDGLIHPANNQTTMPDENGHTVLVGTARCVEPLGWIKNDK